MKMASKGCEDPCEGSGVKWVDMTNTQLTPSEGPECVQLELVLLIHVIISQHSGLCSYNPGLA